LGNNRVVVNASGTAEQINHYYPFGGLFGESTGGSVQRFKYNGKELDRTHGLDWYDYGARHMSPDIGRFTTIDPLAEKDYFTSPYAYCANNPIGNIDIEGKSAASKIIKTAWKIGKEVAKKGVSALNQIDTYTGAIKDLEDNINTITDENASLWEKLGAGASLASEVLPLSMSDIKDAKRGADAIKNAVHGNSKASSKAQHAYDILNKETKKVVKTGVSGGKILKNGKSVRAETQVRKWNKEAGEDIYESKITHKEAARKGARDKILNYERKRANELREELDPDRHKRP
jgi:RHS repeat-associated protein